MLCAIVSLYASSLTLWALDVTTWVQDTHIAFMSNSTIPLPDRKGLVNGNLHGLATQQAALYLFNVRVSSLNSMSSLFNILVILGGGRRQCCPLARMGPLPTSTLDGLYPLRHAFPNVQ
jgi:hypothetical protein